MRSLKPWLRITDLRQELDRLFDRMFESRWVEFPATGDWVPSLDLYETTDALVLTGTVDSWAERKSVVAAARFTPGVQAVEDHLRTELS